eukprot:6506432-Lingulodinium_polyedra.AAC.1
MLSWQGLSPGCPPAPNRQAPVSTRTTAPVCQCTPRRSPRSAYRPGPLCEGARRRHARGNP